MADKTVPASFSSSSIPPFEATPLDEIDARVARLRASFRSTRTKDVAFRLVQLRKLYWALEDNAALIKEGLARDLRKSEFETCLSELGWAKTECMVQINNLEKWAKDEPLKGVPVHFWPMRYRIRREPFGLVLAIGAYNFPYQINISPIVGAIAAGNCAVLKPSEGSPHSAMVLKKIFDEALDPDCYACINGAVDETKHLLDIKWDKIIFTGGTVVGRIVAQKAAETLTPVILELGGRNPAFVTRNADVRLAAKRLLWAKCLNAGQVCLSQNYVLVQRPAVQQFVGHLQTWYRHFYPDGARDSPDLGRMTSKRHFDKLQTMLQKTKGKVVLGGGASEDDLYIEPTVVLLDGPEDSMMADESFGPIWSIVPFDSLDQAIDIANKVDPTPLSLVTFGTKEENEKVLRSVTSGGATCNDSFFHAQIPQSPLGGVGNSGTGSHHGHHSFKAFSHERVIAQVPSWAEKLLEVRYMPYSLKNLLRMQALSDPKPNFDRNGNVVGGLRYWLGLITSLGAKSPQRSVIRWSILVAVAAAMLRLKKGSLGL